MSIRPSQFTSRLVNAACCRGISGRAAWLAALLGAIAFSMPAAAVEQTDSWILRFVLPEQSVWGPSVPSGVRYQGGALATAGPLTGSGLAVDAQAGLGTVSGNIEGWLNVDHETEIRGPGFTTMTINYIGIENESRIETRTGAALDVAANLFFNTGILVPNIGVSIPILNISPLLESVTDFTHFVEAVIDPNDDVTLNPAAHTGNASADFSIAVVEAGVGGQVGVFQRFVYDPSAVVATVTARHLRTGTLISQELGIDALDRSISFHLNRGGHWQIAIEELSLWATLQQEWGIRVGGQVFGKVLGIGPVWDLVLDAPFPERPAPVDLVFDQVPYLGSFVVNVIPVPAAGWLLGSAVMLLAGLRRGRS